MDVKVLGLQHLQEDQITQLYKDCGGITTTKGISLQKGLSLEAFLIKQGKYYDIDLDLDVDDESNCERYYVQLRILRVLLETESIPRERLVEMFVLLSYHINPEMEWCNGTNSDIVKSTIASTHQLLNSVLPDITEILKQKFKACTQKTKTSALKPQLNYFEASGFQPKLISLADFLIEVIDKSWLHNYWSIITSSLLNFFPNKVSIKIQTVKLFDKFYDRLIQFQDTLLHRTGLQKEFYDNLMICINYFPPLTTVEESLDILSTTYPVVIKIIDTDSELTHLASHTIQSVAKTSGEVQKFCLQQLQQIIMKMGYKIMINFNKLNFTINQIMINPDSHNQKECLDIHLLLLQIFKSDDIILNYKYDFLGAWMVILKRMKWDINEDVKLLVQQNINQLCSLDPNITEELHQVADTMTEDYIKEILINV